MDYLSLEQAEKVVFFGEKLEIDKKALAEVCNTTLFAAILRAPGSRLAMLP